MWTSRFKIQDSKKISHLDPNPDPMWTSRFKIHCWRNCQLTNNIKILLILYWDYVLKINVGVNFFKGWIWIQFFQQGRIRINSNRIRVISHRNWINSIRIRNPDGNIPLFPAGFISEKKLIMIKKTSPKKGRYSSWSFIIM